MQENYDKKANVFCKVRMLNGKRLTYQFPNDLRKAMLQSYHEGSLKERLRRFSLQLIRVDGVPEGNS